MKSRTSWAALLLALAVAGCSTDDGPSGDGGGSDDPSSTVSAQATTSAPAPSDSPSAAAATGKEMSDKHVSFHLPAGDDWTVGSGGTVGFLAPPDDRISQITIGGAGATIDDLDEAARMGLASIRETRPKARQEDDRTVGGLEGIVLSSEDEHGYYYAFTTISSGSHVSIIFDLPRNDAAAHELIDAVLASVTWK